jgi:hypothetical protein
MCHALYLAAFSVHGPLAVLDGHQVHGAVLLHALHASFRDHRWSTASPYCAFWLGTWLIWAAEKIVALKPGTWRAAELATTYIQSQASTIVINAFTCTHGNPQICSYLAAGQWDNTCINRQVEEALMSLKIISKCCGAD